MQQVGDRDSLRRVIDDWKRRGQRVALVPTMGNLHDGHMALVRHAAGRADRVVTSIFVNPTQFGPDEDLDRYPRTLEADRLALTEAGCHLLFHPSVQTIYPHGLEQRFVLQAPKALAGILEGKSRPGHFDGVVTVVNRLFNLVRPDVAVFGEKDYQQLQIIRRMVEDLGQSIDILAVETRRDGHGLALSSRNRYLDETELAAARKLNVTLATLARAVRSGERDFPALEEEAERRLREQGLVSDYVSVRRADDLSAPGPSDDDLRILAAVWCGQTRLIDNLNVIVACNHGD